MSPKLDRDGNIIVKRQKPVAQQQQTVATREPQELQQKPVIPVLYDFVIHCTTLSPAGFDMEIVCANCPFKATVCSDTMLIPTDAQKTDIERILMMDEGNE